MAKLLNGAGYDGITAQQDADLYAGIVGGLPVVLPVGERMRAQAVTNNKIRVYDGELVSQGRRIHINAGQSDDFTIENGSQGVVRYDIIGYRIYKDVSGNELAATFVRKNTGAAGMIIEDSIRDGATESYISVYRVKLNGLAIEAVTPLYDMLPALPDIGRDIKELLPELYKTTTKAAESVPNNTTTEIANLTVPSGTYMLYGYADIRNLDTTGYRNMSITGAGLRDLWNAPWQQSGGNHRMIYSGFCSLNAETTLRLKVGQNSGKTGTIYAAELRALRIGPPAIE